MPLLPARVCYAAAVHSHGREYAARYLARLLAERLRAGIEGGDAAFLAEMLDQVASGKHLTVALGFSEDGRPNNFDRDLGIHDDIEGLHATGVALNTCYQRMATKHQLSVSRVKAIHVGMREAHWLARHPDED